MRNFSEKVAEIIKIYISCPITFFPKIRAVYEKM